MIIFDLDGTLADCEHRRHFVDSSKLGTKEDFKNWMKPFIESKSCPTWEPDWKSFYQACDKDSPIPSVRKVLYEFLDSDYYWDKVFIWSGRCVSVKQKTIEWLEMHIDSTRNWDMRLKMRPIGDNTPDEILKERWLDEAISEAKTIDFVFEDRQKVCDMWIRRGIFVFDVSQGKGDF